MANYESDCIESVFKPRSSVVFIKRIEISPRGRGTPWFPPSFLPFFPYDVRELDLGWCIVSRCSKLAREDESMVPPHSSLEDLTSSLISLFLVQAYTSTGPLALSETQYKEDEG